MICAAPWMRAPWTALKPRGPAPSTRTSVPASTGIRRIANPRPHDITHDSNESSAAGTLLTMGTVCSSQATIISAKPPSVPFTGMPSVVSATGNTGLPAPTAHASPRPWRQSQHCPHCAVTGTTTRSPTCTRLTDEPISKTIPTAPCPCMTATGGAGGAPGAAPRPAGAAAAPGAAPRPPPAAPAPAAPGAAPRPAPGGGGMISALVMV